LNAHLELIIFDCDGVLVDSEVISCRAHAETLTRHGYPITADQVLQRFLGVSDREARLIIEREMGRELPADFEAQVKEATLKFYAGDLKAIAGVADAIAAIGLPKCVASSGTPEKIRHGLDCAGLYEQLAPHIFSAIQVKRGKPAPDLFLLAASQMRAAPERCVVIEDSVPGVTGARARLSRRQPLPAGSRQTAVRCRRGCGVRRHAAFAGFGQARRVR
jgi:HAD superfamily hydrolase (TIGR01509 family)